MPPPRLRLLIVSHPPVVKGYGAAQIAMSLGDALGERGHDVTVWSPEPLEPSRLGWSKWILQRRAIEDLLARSRPFDVIDLPPISISTAVSDAVPLVVARSVQPDLRYMESERRSSPAPGSRGLAWRVVGALTGFAHARAIAAGWRRASLGLCLGSLEHRWMSERFPELASRLFTYVAAPSAEEREGLARVASARGRFAGGPISWLWVGRWAAHKGTDRLLEILRQRIASTDDRFTIAGCGEPLLPGIVHDWLRKGRLKVVPSFSRPALLGLLAESNAGLFTSEVEGWGLSVQEMLESGLPVFATVAGCVPDLSRHVERGLEFLPLPNRPLVLDRVTVSPSYWTRFDWTVVARDYEARVYGALGERAEDAF